MKKSNKKTLAKRGVAVAGRALNPSGSQVHADKRKPQRSLQKQRLKIQLQHETARSRGPFPFLLALSFRSSLSLDELAFNSVWKR
jgi:hypothetical protein